LQNSVQDMNSASAFAAQTKSLADRPLIAWVV
jgi:hypothetical protein